MSIDVLSAWQTALATEQAAVWGYSVLGPRLGSPAEVAQARTDQQAHRELVVLTRSQLSTAGETPVEPAASYPLPYPVGDDAAARQLALRLESASASAWRYLLAVAASTGAAVAGPPSPTGTPTPAPTGPGLFGLRSAALAALTDSALRALGWRRLVSPSSPTVAFPGL